MTIDRAAYVVGRPRSRVVFQRVILPVMTMVFGGVFLVLVWATATGRSSVGAALGPLALTGILAAVTVAIFLGERRRAGSSYSLEADSRGIRVAGMPWLAWSDVAELRAESVVGFGGGDHDEDEGTTVSIGPLEIPLDRGTAERRMAMGPTDTGAARMYRRIGVVPRDASMVPPQSGLARSLDGFVKRMREASQQRVGGHAIDLAPFGVYDYELDASFDEVVARLRDFREVVEVSEHLPASSTT